MLRLEKLELNFFYFVGVMRLLSSVVLGIGVVVVVNCLVFFRILFLVLEVKLFVVIIVLGVILNLLRFLKKI